MKWEQVAKKKEDYIKRFQQSFFKDIGKIENALVTKILEAFYKELGASKGVIEDASGTRIKLSTALARVMTEFKKNGTGEILDKLVNGSLRIADLSRAQYEVFAEGKRQYDAMYERAKAKALQEIGITKSGGVLKGGELDKLLNSKKMQAEAYKHVVRTVKKDTPIEDLSRAFKQEFISNNEQSGIIMSRVRTYVYDKFQSFERGIANDIAVGLELDYAVYSGGSIATTRDFCRKKNNKVFSREDMKEWKDDPDLPLSKEEEKAGEPSNYDPEQDLGRWNCRHFLRWIPKEEAQRLGGVLKEGATKEERERFLLSKGRGAVNVETVEGLRNAKFTDEQQQMFDNFDRIPLKGEDAELQDLAIRKYILNKDELVKQYLKENGKIINTDEARKLFIDIGYKGTNAAAVHEASSRVVKDAEAQLMKKGGNNQVGFYAGSAGSGKTSTIEKAVPEIKDSDAIIDGVFGNFGSASSKIKKAVDNGKAPHLAYVYRDYQSAWKGVIDRMLYNKNELGRGVAGEAFIEGWLGSRATVDKLYQAYADIPGAPVKFTLIDNSRGQGLSKEITYEEFQQLPTATHDQIRSDIIAITDQYYSYGRLSNEQYNALLGSLGVRKPVSQRPPRAQKKPEQKPNADIHKKVKVVAKDLNQLDKEMDGHREKIPKNEQLALKAWQNSNGYFRKLDGGDDSYGEMTQVVGDERFSTEDGLKAINDFMDKAPKYEGEVYRGLNSVPDSKMKFWLDVQVGSIIRWDAVTGFSLSERVAEDFADRGNTVFFRVKVKSVVPIYYESEFRAEMEALAFKQTAYIVTKKIQRRVHDSWTEVYLWMEEMT